MLNAGWITRSGNADPIHHFESPRRNWTRMDYYGPRNKILYAWQNVPLPFLSAHISMTTARAAVHALTPSRLFTRVRGIADAYRFICAGKCSRVPVRAETYALARELKRRGAVSLDEIIHRLLPSSSPTVKSDHCIATTVS
jgi:hypothetical protein